MKARVLPLLFTLAAVACQGSMPAAPTPGSNGVAESLSGRPASTGGEGPDAVWQSGVEPEAASRVLRIVDIAHRSEDRFNLFVCDGSRPADLHLSLAARADDGRIDQGGGPIWRVQDANNYYVCRFNPLESNFRVYVVKDGVRHQLGTALAPTAAGQWHRIDVEHRGDHIRCWLDGVLQLDVHDAAIAAAGAVGFWSKADARTSFEGLTVRSL